MGKNQKTSPKILLIDIETAPMLSYTWGLWDQTIALNQIKSDWHILSWSAKWLHDAPSKIMYKDQRHAKKIEEDKELLKDIWKLLDEADIVIGQNSKAFDTKKLNARFVLNGMRPPSSYKHIDTMLLARKHFAFTSNKLQYMTDKLCVKYKKIEHEKFGGFKLWRECLAGNMSAWNTMEKYNKYDVLSLEELYTKLIPWDSSINFSLYSSDLKHTCSCGSTDMNKNGFCYTSVGKYQRYSCVKCGAEVRGRKSLFSKEKKSSLKAGVPR